MNKEILKKLAKPVMFSCLAAMSLNCARGLPFSNHTNSDFTPFIREKDFANGSSVRYCDDFEIYWDDWCDNMKDFRGVVNEVFGTVTKSGTEYGYGERVVYRSHWAPSQPDVMESFTERIFTTYKFSHYVSVPIKEATSSYCLNPGESVTYTIQNSTSSSETFSEAVETSYALTMSFTEKMGMSIGASIPLGNIELGGKLSSEASIGVTETISSTVKREASRQIVYSEYQSSTWKLHNKTSKKRFYQFNFRKVFKLYFTTQYKYNYSCTRTGVNLWGLDDQFDYTFLNYIPERTVFFLVPIDSNVFFGCDEYYNNADGNLQIATPFEDNIVYL